VTVVDSIWNIVYFRAVPKGLTAMGDAPKDRIRRRRVSRSDTESTLGRLRKKQVGEMSTTTSQAQISGT